METLGLVGDGDDVDLLRSVESSFDVQFGDEVAAWRTVGDVYEALLVHLDTSTERGLCATSMAFYRLRAVLVGHGAEPSLIQPSARLAELAPHGPRRLFAQVGNAMSVSGPPITMSWWGCGGALLTLLGLVAGLRAFSGVLPWPWILLVPAGVLMVKVDPGAYGVMSVGGLAKSIAIRNFAHFSAEGADMRPESVWRTLCELVAEEVDIDPSNVGPKTRLLWKVT